MGHEVMALTELPTSSLNLIFQHLDLNDIHSLTLTCHRFSEVCSSNEIWKGLYISNFGDIHFLAGLLKQAGVENLKERKEDHENWKLEFKKKKLNREQFDVQAITDKYTQVEQILENLDQESENQLTIACDIILDILDEHIDYTNGYYSLGYVCFILNEYESALHFIDIGQELDPESTTLIKLREDVQKQLESIEGGEDEEPLLDGKQLSDGFKEVLNEIFRDFDKDKDGSWSLKEISNYITATNGAPPNPQVPRYMVRNYNSTRAGHLTFQGFCEFYRRQTIGDPEETRKDLATLGYNRSFIKFNTILPSVA